ncbi:MAG: hypothetical protein GXO30_08630 [Epsilonproteobacteria bacterium]|nr:hypothetical protein [Campylobacterota bacterium]
MRYIALFFILIFSACSTKNYEITQTKIIIIKSPKLKFADVGYIRNSDNSIELELFSAGKVVEKITINHLICTTKGCMSKGGFNQEYLDASYPKDMLQNILLAKSIYESKNMQKTKDGFEQNIKDENVDITYKVKPKIIFFKDRKNKIILKIKDTK